MPYLTLVENRGLEQVNKQLKIFEKEYCDSYMKTLAFSRSFLNDAQFISCLEKYGRLTTVSLEHCPNISFTGYSQLANRPLVNLKIRECGITSATALIHCLSLLTLRHIDLSEIDMESIAALRPLGPLTTLRLKMTGIGYPEIEILHSYLESLNTSELKHVGLEDSLTLSQDTIDALGLSIEGKAIESIELSGTHIAHFYPLVPRINFSKMRECHFHYTFLDDRALDLLQPKITSKLEAVTFYFSSTIARTIQFIQSLPWNSLRRLSFHFVDPAFNDSVLDAISGKLNNNQTHVNINYNRLTASSNSCLTYLKSLPKSLLSLELKHDCAFPDEWVPILLNSIDPKKITRIVLCNANGVWGLTSKGLKTLLEQLDFKRLEYIDITGPFITDTIALFLASKLPTANNLRYCYFGECDIFREDSLETLVLSAKPKHNIDIDLSDASIQNLETTGTRWPELWIASQDDFDLDNIPPPQSLVAKILSRLQPGSNQEP